MALSRSGRIARALATAAVVSLPVLLLALLVREQFDPLVDADHAVIRAATDTSRAAGLAPALIVVQEVTQPKYLYVLATGVCVWAWRREHLKTRALWAFATMMAAWNLGLLAKLVVQRARPVIDEPLTHAPGYSFPSGHALNAAVVATAMVYLLWPVLRSALARAGAVAGATAFVLAVAVDRVMIGAHFPSDVVAGLILGGGITVSSWIGFIGRTAVTSSPGPSAPASSSGG